MQLELKRIGIREKKNQTWTLELDTEQVALTDFEDTIVAQFPAAHSPVYLRLSISKGTRLLSVKNGQDAWNFEIDKIDFKSIQNYIDRHVAAAGPQVIQQVQTFARRLLLVGVGCLVLAALLAVGFLASKPSVGKGLMLCGLPLFGFTALFCCCRSVFYYRYYHRLQALASAANDE